MPLLSDGTGTVGMPSALSVCAPSMIACCAAVAALMVAAALWQRLRALRVRALGARLSSAVMPGGGTGVGTGGGGVAVVVGCGGCGDGGRDPL